MTSVEEAPDLVSYELAESIATITMDDGKVNVMSLPMMAALNGALDRAETDGAVVLLTGRPRIFSGGYDMALFSRSADEIVATLRAGGNLVQRILGFPTPVVAACNGHAVAQGAFVLLAADSRIGTAGPFKIGLNEVAIGLTIPHYGVEVARMRLSAPWFNHATTTGELYDPTAALAAGFLDRTVDTDELASASRDEAVRLTKLDMSAHLGTKLRVRRHALEQIRAMHDEEFPASAG